MLEPISPQRLQLFLSLSYHNICLIQLKFQLAHHPILVLNLLHECLLSALELFEHLLIDQLQSPSLHLEVLKSEQKHPIILVHPALQLDLVLLDQLLFLLGVHLTLHQGQGFLQQLHLHPFLGREKLSSQTLITLLQLLHLLPESAILHFQNKVVLGGIQARVAVDCGLEPLELVDDQGVFLWIGCFLFGRRGVSSCFPQEPVLSAESLFRSYFYQQQSASPMFIQYPLYPLSQLPNIPPFSSPLSLHPPLPLPSPPDPHLAAPLNQLYCFEGTHHPSLHLVLQTIQELWILAGVCEFLLELLCLGFEEGDILEVLGFQKLPPLRREGGLGGL